jgi:hypothetical protein
MNTPAQTLVSRNIKKKIPNSDGLIRINTPAQLRLWKHLLQDCLYLVPTKKKGKSLKKKRVVVGSLNIFCLRKHRLVLSLAAVCV